MRGKVGAEATPEPFIGITPAYAGKSLHPAGIHPGRRDHPRICGEKYTRFLRQLNTAGSPPHMRGKEDCVFRGVFRVRITPAYAGKREPGNSGGWQQPDHPRICGEKKRTISAKYSRLGSPPHMRGKDGLNGALLACPRITPAYAGKSVLGRSPNLREWDHPRICGEKTDCLICSSW